TTANRPPCWGEPCVAACSGVGGNFALARRPRQSRRCRVAAGGGTTAASKISTYSVRELMGCRASSSAPPFTPFRLAQRSRGPRGCGDDRARLAQEVTTQRAISLLVLTAGTLGKPSVGLESGAGVAAVQLRSSWRLPVPARDESQRIAEERDQDDARDRHVVLEGIEEEEETAEERKEREDVARRKGLAHDQTE